MNGKGLVANLLYLAESEYPTPAAGNPRLPLSIFVWAQDVLDNFAMVAEAMTAPGADVLGEGQQFPQRRQGLPLPGPWKKNIEGQDNSERRQDSKGPSDAEPLEGDRLARVHLGQQLGMDLVTAEDEKGIHPRPSNFAEACFKPSGVTEEEWVVEEQHGEDRVGTKRLQSVKFRFRPGSGGYPDGTQRRRAEQAHSQVRAPLEGPVTTDGRPASPQVVDTKGCLHGVEQEPAAFGQSCRCAACTNPLSKGHSMRRFLPLLLLVLVLGCGCASSRNFGLEITLPKGPGTPPVSHEQILSFVASSPDSQEVLQSVAHVCETNGLDSRELRHPYVSSIFGTSALLVQYSRESMERDWLWPHTTHLEWSVSVSVVYNPDRHRLLVLVGQIGTETLSPELYRQLHEELHSRLGAGSVHELWK